MFNLFNLTLKLNGFPIEKARIELRQNEATNFESEIFVKPVSHSMDQLQMLLEAKIKDKVKVDDSALLDKDAAAE